MALKLVETIRAFTRSRYPFLFRLATEHRTLGYCAFATLFAAAIALQYAILIRKADQLVISNQNLVGGDYVVFREAAKAAGSPNPAALYKADTLRTRLERQFPQAGAMTVQWQYPPTMFFVVAPLSRLGFMTGYWAWEIALAMLFCAALRYVKIDRDILLIGLLSPVVVQSIITGQNGMLSASLLLWSGIAAISNPLLAGLATGVLTLKPQFGVVIPLAFVAAKCWRAMLVATITAVLCALVSLSVYGTSSWQGFLQSVADQSERLTTTAFPLGKLMTFIGAVQLLGGSAGVAKTIQAITSILLVIYVAVVWRRLKDSRLRTIALMSSAPLVTPYALYYEGVIMLVPMLMVAQMARKEGWLKYEELSFVLLWIAPLLLPGGNRPLAIPVTFLAASATFLVCNRRIFPSLRHVNASPTP